VLDVALNSLVVEFSTDQALRIEDGVVRVHGHLVLGGVADQTLSVGEGDVGWGGSVTLIVGDNLHLAMLEDADAGVGGPKVNTCKD